MADGSMDMRLPLTPQEITAGWLSEALQFRHPGLTVKSVDVVDIINGTSTKIRVAVTYGAGGQIAGLPPTLIVKGGFEAHSQWMAKMYADEVRFYRDVKPYIDMNTPACFYAGSDPETHQSVVILEDLKPKGVTFLDPLQPCSYEQIARRLDAMARYHAQTWDSPDFNPGGRFDWMTTRYQGFGKQFIARYLEPDCWNHFMREPRGAAVSVRLHDRDWMKGALEKLEDYHKAMPPVVIHGDTHLGNLYLEADGTPGFLDAQTCKAPWQMEVNYHLIVACDIADRKSWEPALIARYLEKLKTYGVDAPCFEMAWESYRRETAYGYFIFVINESYFQTEAVNTAEAARFGAAALDHDTIRLLS
jgi:hypothetical protein